MRSDEGKNKLYAGAEVTLEAALAAQDAVGSGLRGDFIDSGSGDDVVVGDSGNDALNGGQGDDILLGGAGDDNIDADLETTSVAINWSISRSVTTDAYGATQYLTTYNGVSLSAPTTGGNDAIYGGGGADWVRAGYGNDYVDGGADADVLFGQGGSDDLFGGSGNDLINGDNGRLPVAEHGDDYLDGDDTVLAGDGVGTRLPFMESQRWRDGECGPSVTNDAKWKLAA